VEVDRALGLSGRSGGKGDERDVVGEGVYVVEGVRLLLSPAIKGIFFIRIPIADPFQAGATR
jgi:hypothetical protein